ncbi:hypothetical protein ACPCHT_27660 [Nucisporomicrobium flavum]|jgi:hypothetical protein|uniref:hypothetical protein n=1 Tax=Nucisporomicrobium flavum TaxID=2785915 RepID=UPI003C2C36F8
MSGDDAEWTGPVPQRIRCCICGDDTAGADDYVVIGVITEESSGEIQYLGAHAAHLEGVMARGFTVEVTLM